MIDNDDSGFEGQSAVSKLKLLQSLNDEMAPNYERFSTEGNWDSPKRLADKIVKDLPETGKMLDLGIGTGWLEDALELPNGWQITGVDISGEMLKLAGERHPGIVLKQGLIQDFELLVGDEKYDLIASTGALEFAPDMIAITHQMSDSLNTAGIVAFTYEAREPGQPNWRNYPTATATENGEVTIYRRSKDEVDSALLAAGLEVTSHEMYDAYERDSRPVPYGLVVARKIT